MEDTEFIKIKALTDAYLDRPLDDFPSEEEIARQQVLSDRFLRRMDRLLKKARKQQKKFDRMSTISFSKPKSTIKKRLLVAAIICAVLASAVSVYANREAIAGFIVQVFEKFTSIKFQQPTETSGSATGTEPSDDITDHLPTLVPQGYEKTDEVITSALVQIIYMDESGSELIFMKTLKEGTHLGLDTEGIELEKLTVKGYSGFYYKKNDQSSLIWADNRFAYSIIGKITKSEMLELANSTN